MHILIFLSKIWAKKYVLYMAKYSNYKRKNTNFTEMKPLIYHLHEV